jgi:hypothetical protein
VLFYSLLPLLSLPVSISSYVRCLNLNSLPSIDSQSPTPTHINCLLAPSHRNMIPFNFLRTRLHKFLAAFYLNNGPYMRKAGKLRLITYCKYDLVIRDSGVSRLNILLLSLDFFFGEVKKSILKCRLRLWNRLSRKTWTSRLSTIQPCLAALVCSLYPMISPGHFF